MVTKNVFLGIWTPKHDLSSTIPQKGTSGRETTRFQPQMFQILPYLWSVGEMKEFVWLTDFDCVCVKKTQTSPIPPAKFGEPILLRFCTTTQLRDVITYSGRRLNSHFVFTGGRIFRFCRAMRCISAAYAVMRCLCVCHVRKLCQKSKRIKIS